MSLNSKYLDTYILSQTVHAYVCVPITTLTKEQQIKQQSKWVPIKRLILTLAFVLIWRNFDFYLFQIKFNEKMYAVTISVT